MKAIFGLAAFALNFIGYIPYIRDIVRSKVKPHPITWAVWTILTTIAALNQISNDGGYSSLFFVSTAFLVGIVFILSFRYGIGGAGKIDLLCLILALLLLVYWITVKDTRLSTVLAVTIDAIGAIPTVIKTYKKPETETYIQWSLAAIAGFFTMLSVPRFDIILLLYPIYVVVMNGAIVGAKYYKEHFS